MEKFENDDAFPVGHPEHRDNDAVIHPADSFAGHNRRRYNAAITDASEDSQLFPDYDYLGHAQHRDNAVIPAADDAGNGLAVDYVAIDFGSYPHLSWNGELGARLRVPSKNGKGRRYCDDLVECIEYVFRRGFDVVTEASTFGSFKVRDRTADIEQLLERFPERRLWTIGGHSVGNLLRSRGIDYNSKTDDDLAAQTIYELARRSVKRWRPPNPAEQIYRTDPVRPHYGELVALRNAGYPDDMWRDHVWCFIWDAEPPGGWTRDQRAILFTNNNWDRPRTSALVYSLREPSSRSRRGWERVIGASSHGHPSIYRQILAQGKPRPDYQRELHVTGLPRPKATRALRQLRSLILNKHPELRFSWGNR